MDEKIEIWILFVPLIVPFVFVFYDYYAHAIRDNYRFYFTNNSINYVLNGKLKRKININEVPNYLLKPFWKNKLNIESILFIFVLVVFIIFLWIVLCNKTFAKGNLLYYYILVFI